MTAVPNICSRARMRPSTNACSLRASSSFCIFEDIPLGERLMQPVGNLLASSGTQEAQLNFQLVVSFLCYERRLCSHRLFPEWVSIEPVSRAHVLLA